MWHRTKALLGRSLVGRLVLAQVATALLLWLAAIAYLVHDTARYDEIFEQRLIGPRADMILSVVDSLASQPERLADALVKIDRMQRNEHQAEDAPALRLAMNVWQGDRLLLATPGEPGVVRTTLLRQLERIEVDGKMWRTYSQQSDVSNARVTLMRSGHPLSIIFALESRGILVLPLLISLPFLVLPAWVSVRVALRPWRKFSAEVESRGPGNLTPLQFGTEYRELRPISQAVDALLERVRKGVARERNFIADAAHELRTPLAAMRVNVEALQAHRVDERDNQLLTGLLRSNERASRLVTQLLGLMRSDAERPDSPAEHIELDQLVQDRLAELSPLASARNVELELQAEPGCRLLGEREALTSLIDNLIENAIKYSPQASRVLVRVGRDGEEAVLVVEDSGSGIPQELRERAFDRFFRAPDQTQPGTGLGLAIVKSVADRHRATINLSEGEGGRGLRATVRFATRVGATTNTISGL